MKFTFIVCTRNSERVLGEVLDSIKFQTGIKFDFEVIIVDYKSTDSTLEIAHNKFAGTAIKFRAIRCETPGKSPALILGLNCATGDYIVVVDDDNILAQDYISNASDLIESVKDLGCVGAIGLVDKGLKLPKWFSRYSFIYAIDAPVKDLNNVENVWGAGALIKREAWEKLQSAGYRLTLNPSRESHSIPIIIGGEDSELSSAIKMIGYKVFYSTSLCFVHKFEQSRLTEKYMLRNSYGATRATALLDIYSLVINRPLSRFPYLVWTSILFKRLIGCGVRAVVAVFGTDFLSSKFQIFRATAIIRGYFDMRKSFHKIYQDLNRIKYKSTT